jgi:UPF0271 protein
VIFVLDTSAVLNNFQVDTDSDVIIPSAVVEELTSEKGKERLGILVALGASVEAPSPESLMQTKEAAEALGELGRLSDTDLEIVAIAFEREACLVSDDYSIENLCSYANIDFMPVGTEGIKEVFEYVYRCTGCRRLYRRYYEQCPVCGSPLKARRI